MQYISSLIELSVFAHRCNPKVNNFSQVCRKSGGKSQNGVYDDRRFGIVESEELKILKMLDVRRTENCQISWNERYMYLFIRIFAPTEIEEFENCLPKPL